MSDDAAISISTGPPETVLPAVAPEWDEALRRALGLPDAERRSALSAVAADHPRFVAAWAWLSVYGRDDVESYAYARVGYHRGLDALRSAGWRGTGYVRWHHATNQGFLRAVEALRRGAEAIGELDEAERCAVFLRQLDPHWRGIPRA